MATGASNHHFQSKALPSVGERVLPILPFSAGEVASGVRVEKFAVRSGMPQWWNPGLSAKVTM